MSPPTKPRMTLAEVAPEIRTPVRLMPRAPVTSALGRWLIQQALRLLPATQVDGVQLDLRTTNDGVALRVYTPVTGQTGAGLLWIHGGGMLIGGAVQDDLFCSVVAHELGLVVVSVEYRLAPEFPFPAPLDDCYAAWAWLRDSAAQLNLDPIRLAIGGQSAGGGLAASLVQRIHDTGGLQPAAQWLFCPMLDDRTATRAELDAISHKMWDNRQNRVGWQSFLGVAPGSVHVPTYAVPARRADLSGLPPAWIGTGDIELFFDENKAYADRLTSAGVTCTFDIVRGAVHGFETIARSSTLAQAYLSRARAWLGQQLTARRS